MVACILIVTVSMTNMEQATINIIKIRFCNKMENYLCNLRFYIIKKEIALNFSTKSFIDFWDLKNNIMFQFDKL